MNPGHLKLELATRGVHVDVSAHPDEIVRRQTPGIDRPASVEILLPEDLWVSAPLDEGSGPTAPFTLVADDGHFVLVRDQERVDVRPASRPAFYSASTSEGTPMSQVGTVMGGFIAIPLAGACGFAMHSRVCDACAGRGGTGSDATFSMKPLEVVEVLQEAFAEGVAEFVYFDLGYIESDDAGIAALEPYVRAIKRHFDTLVAVRMHPPRRNDWIDQTYAMGVDALSFGIEIFDAEILAQRCPGRIERIGRERYFEALRYAAAVYPSGTVWSELILDLEPRESTIRGIDVLTEMGVLPVVSLSRTLAGQLAPTVDDVAPVLAHLFHAVRTARINMGWVRDLSTAITPLEARFFAGDDARVAVAMQQFYRSRLGTMATRNLSRLRRRLRVRRVGESFDSSHL